MKKHLQVAPVFFTFRHTSPCCATRDVSLDPPIHSNVLFDAQSISKSFNSFNCAGKKPAVNGN